MVYAIPINITNHSILKNNVINTEHYLLREQELARWVLETLSKQSVSDDHSGLLPLQAIGSDAGFRRYFRVQSPAGTLVAVDAPPVTEDTETFVAIAKRWRKNHIRVPDILAEDTVRGFMLQEDFGDRHLHDDLSPATVDHYYSQCFGTLLTIQQQPSDLLPVYDSALQLQGAEPLS